MKKDMFVYFDLGGVVFNFSGGLQAMAVKHHLSYLDFKTVFKKYDDKICRGHMSPAELWVLYQQELGFTEDINFLDYWVSHFTPIKGTHKLMADLVQAGIPIGIITNIYRGVFKKAIDKGMIPQLPYAVIIQSCEVSYVKPEIEIYQIAQQKSNHVPKKLVLIDDKPEYLEPATQLGWHTIRMDEEASSAATDAIRNIVELS